MPLPQAPTLFDLYHDDDDRHHSELRVAYTQNVAGGSLKTGYELRHEDEDDDYSDPTGLSPLTLQPAPNLANHYLFLQWVERGLRHLSARVRGAGRPGRPAAGGREVRPSTS